MYQGLIDHLTFAYTFICKGRGKISKEDIGAIVEGAHTVARNAETVIGGDQIHRPDDCADLQEAGKIDEHIEDMYQFLMHMEIV